MCPPSNWLFGTALQFPVSINFLWVAPCYRFTCRIPKQQHSLRVIRFLCRHLKPSHLFAILLNLRRQTLSGAFSPLDTSQFSPNKITLMFVPGKCNLISCHRTIRASKGKSKFFQSKQEPRVCSRNLMEIYFLQWSFHWFFQCRLYIRSQIFHSIDWLIVLSC